MKKAKQKIIRNVLVVGATSSLAKPLCVMMAERGWNLVLAGRDTEELERMKGDFTIRYAAKVECCQCDLTDAHFSGVQLLAEASGFGEIDLLLIVAGEVGDPKLRADDYEIDRIARINYLSPIKLMASFAERSEARRAGDIIVISSVAGDRGRQSNYTYGSAKAGLSVYAAGLRNRLADKKCHVMTVKPGFVDTPMTYNINSGLIAPRDKVAEIILKAFDARKNEVYVPAIWGLIMFVIRHIPETVFKRMKL